VLPTLSAVMLAALKFMWLFIVAGTAITR